jgi:hypothetical protein
MVYNESSVSSAKFDAIADIHPDKEDIRINVRVLRLWKVPTFLNPSENGSIEMVLVDDKVIFILYLAFSLFMCFFIKIFVDLGW